MRCPAVGPLEQPASYYLINIQREDGVALAGNNDPSLQVAQLSRQQQPPPRSHFTTKSRSPRAAIAMEDIDKKRYDLFISFHGNEVLSNPDLRPGTTTRQLAEEVETRIRTKNPTASIFFDTTELHESLTDIFKAVMQIRGGGVALFLLTKEFFTRKYCVAELRACLYVHEIAERSGNTGVKFRFICLEQSVQDIMNDSQIKELNLPLSLYVLHCDGFVRGTMPAVAQAVVEMVTAAWNGKPTVTILGETAPISFMQLSGSFGPTDIPSALSVLDVDDPLGQIYRMETVFERARKSGAIGYYDVEKLYPVIAMAQSGQAEKQKMALRAYKRKWIAGLSWVWDDRLYSELSNFVGEAEADIGRCFPELQDEEQSG